MANISRELSRKVNSTGKSEIRSYKYSHSVTIKLSLTGFDINHINEITRPNMRFMGMGPHLRESSEVLKLSPIT